MYGVRRVSRTRLTSFYRVLRSVQTLHDVKRDGVRVSPPYGRSGVDRRSDMEPRDVVPYLLLRRSTLHDSQMYMVRYQDPLGVLDYSINTRGKMSTSLTLSPSGPCMSTSVSLIHRLGLDNYLGFSLAFHTRESV